MISICILIHIVNCEKPNIILLFADDVSGNIFVICIVYAISNITVVPLLSGHQLSKHSVIRTVDVWM